MLVENCFLFSFGSRFHCNVLAQPARWRQVSIAAGCEEFEENVISVFFVFVFVFSQKLAEGLRRQHQTNIIVYQVVAYGFRFLSEIDPIYPTRTGT